MTGIGPTLAGGSGVGPRLAGGSGVAGGLADGFAFAERHNVVDTADYNGPRFAFAPTQQRLLISERVGASNALVDVWDISDLDAVTLEATFSPSGDVDDAGTIGYDEVHSWWYCADSIADDWYAMQVNEPPSTVTHRQTIALSNIDGAGYTMILDGGNTVVVIDNGSLQVRNALSSYALLGSTTVGAGTFLTVVDANTLAGANTTTHYVINVTNRAAPAVVWSGTVAGSASNPRIGATVDGLWVPSATSGQFFRVSLTANTILNTFTSPLTGTLSICSDIDGNGQYLFLHNGTQGCIAYVGNPTAPVYSQVVTYTNAIATDHNMRISDTGLAVVGSLASFAEGAVRRWSLMSFATA